MPMHGDPDGPLSLGTGSALKFSVEMTPVTCDADLGFAQVTPAAQGGKLPSPNRQLDFDSALDFYTPIGAVGPSGLWACSLLSPLSQTPRLTIASV